MEEAQRALREYVHALERPTLSLHYEDLIADENEFVRLALSFLGLPVRPVAGRSIKNTSDDLREIVLNLDELRGHFAGTRYAPMFDEVLRPARPLDIVR